VGGKAKVSRAPRAFSHSFFSRPGGRQHHLHLRLPQHYWLLAATCVASKMRDPWRRNLPVCKAASLRDLLPSLLRVHFCCIILALLGLCAARVFLAAALPGVAYACRAARHLLSAHDR